MFWVNLKIAFRTIRKHKIYALTNVGGLALGLTCAGLMLLFITYELSYDRHHENASRIYRLTYEYQRGDQVRKTSYLPQSLPLKNEFPEVEKFARLFTYSWMEKALVAHADRSFFEDRFFLADPTIFEVFSFDVLRGNPQTALDDPASLVISESAADKYFGEEDPVGKVLSVRNLRQSDLVVTAVIEDMPENSHFKCDFLAPMAAGEDLFWDGFDERNSSHVYLLLKEGASPELLTRKFPPFLASHLGDETEGAALGLQPLTSIHLHSHFSGEIEDSGNMATVYLMAVLALIVLSVAAINFVNLATARSINRAREVGLKKVVGAGRGDLVRQFLAEAVFFSFLALPAALVLVQVLLPAFNLLLDANLILVFSGNGWLFGGMVLLTASLGFLSGIYPAFVVSGFTPISVLKGRFHLGSKGSLVRRSLVILQFAASVVLLIGAAVVYGQMRYIQAKDLGFDRSPIVIIPVKDYETTQAYDLVKTAFLRDTSVLSVTASQGLPSRFRSTHAVWYEGLPRGEDVELAAVAVDFDFLDTFGVALAAGRDFASEFLTDEKRAYLVNETAARSFGWTEPLGKKIQFSNRGLMRPMYESGEVVGVVEDFHFRSLHEGIAPLVLKIEKSRMTHIAARFAPGKILPALDFLKARWNEILPGRPFDHFFFEDDVERIYQEERRTGRIFASSTLLSMIIAGLGIFGLAAFSAVQRTKEVGIRRVLGASTERIVWMITREFGLLVLLANAAAWPLAYYLMSRWLGGFAYRAGIGIGVFLFAAAFSLLIALGAVGGLALKAALADPVDSLRYE